MSCLESGPVLDLVNGGLKGSDNILWILRPKDGSSGHNNVAPLGNDNGYFRLNSFPSLSWM